MAIFSVTYFLNDPTDHKCCYKEINLINLAIRCVCPLYFIEFNSVSSIIWVVYNKKILIITAHT